MSLALLNLLPLLPLDGGHILFSLIEAVRRRALAREVYERVGAVVGFRRASSARIVLIVGSVAAGNDLESAIGATRTDGCAVSAGRQAHNVLVDESKRPASGRSRSGA